MARGKKVGSIYTEIRARLDRLDRDFGTAHTKSKKAAGRIQSAINKITFNQPAKSLKKFMGLFGATMAVGGLTRLIGGSIDVADALGKMAKATGLSTGNLQELEHAANLSGVGTDVLHSSVIAFSKRLGEARSGVGALTTFLNKFDNSLLESIKATKSTDAALEIYFKRMAQVSNVTDRAALSAAAFGRAGVKMGIMVTDGVAGLEKMRREAQEMGLVLGKDIIKNAEVANDKMSTLGKVLKLTFTKAVVENADSLARAMEKITRITLSIGKAFAGKSELELVRDRITQIKESIAEISTSRAPGKARMLESLNAALRRAELQTYSLGQTWDETTRKLAAGIVAPTVTPADIGKQLKDNIKVITPLTDMWATFYDEQTRAASEASAKKAAVLQSYELSSNEKTVLALTDMWATFNDEQTRAASAASIAKAEALKSVSGAAAITADALVTSFTSATNHMSDALANFVIAGKLSFKGFADALISDLVRIQSRMLIMGLMSKIGGALGGTPGASPMDAYIMHSGGVVGSSPTVSRRVPAMMFAGAPRLHRGLAGDEFPAILQKGETVIPKGGGGTTIVVYNISAVDSQSFEEAARRSGAIPLLAAESLNDNGLLRSAMINNL